MILTLKYFKEVLFPSFFNILDGFNFQDLNDDTRFIEFYNLVFMEFNKKDDGSLEPLEQKNIDTGLGLERMARILQKVSAYLPVLQYIEYNFLHKIIISLSKQTDPVVHHRIQPLQ